MNALAEAISTLAAVLAGIAGLAGLAWGIPRYFASVRETEEEQ